MKRRWTGEELVREADQMAGAILREVIRLLEREQELILGIIRQFQESSE